MVRGRKKDLTAPPTRQLTLQRDYRARKARYISELEERCSRAEGENARLRRELEVARATIPFASPREVVQMSSELLRDLAKASASIVRFQEITAPRTLALTPDDNFLHRRQPPISSYSHSPAGPTGFRPPSFPCPGPLSQPVTLPSLHAHARNEPPARLTLPNQVLPIHGQPIDRIPSRSSSASPQPSEARSSPSLESTCCGGYIDCNSECCGGLLDCTGLVESEGESEGQGDQDSGRKSPNHHTSKLD
ncbi:hypothetical protein K503DRAFT_797313 [Rhizopogon vinicolor AM-OR11-026]|uniref:BZIP domain-containing protein n=1 Tax=Rhizopogon vinicolor AM-OR11-026 TaxID=1314800 RepID=A0A1B7NBX2_9AGAM|nr:hypothetical protein K503DRAFT_797313 [Rhizopogon vinicolor AM-OR11-026]